MKPTSVIFIIVSVLIICLGVLLCITANSMAADMGIPIFAQTGDEENNYTTTEVFESEELKKIILNFSDVKINIYGGAQEDKVELVNFTDGTYVYSMSKSTMQIYENSGITSFIDLDNFKIYFNGFRDYLHYFKYRDQERQVNLYLKDTASVIKFEITSKSGDISINDLGLGCDYKITTATGNLTLQNVKTDSNITLESTKDSVIEIKNVSARAFDVNALTGYVTIKDTSFTHALSSNIASGSFEYDRVEADFAGFNVELSAPNGTLRVFDTAYNTYYTETNVTELPPEDTSKPEDPEQTPPADGEAEDTTEDTEEDATPDNEVEKELNSITVTVVDGNIKIY